MRKVMMAMMALLVLSACDNSKDKKSEAAPKATKPSAFEGYWVANYNSNDGRPELGKKDEEGKLIEGQFNTDISYYHVNEKGEVRAIYNSYIDGFRAMDIGNIDDNGYFHSSDELKADDKIYGYELLEQNELWKLSVGGHSISVEVDNKVRRVPQELDSKDPKSWEKAMEEFSAYNYRLYEISKSEFEAFENHVVTIPNAIFESLNNTSWILTSGPGFDETKSLTASEATPQGVIKTIKFTKKNVDLFADVNGSKDVVHGWLNAYTKKDEAFVIGLSIMNMESIENHPLEPAMGRQWRFDPKKPNEITVVETSKKEDSEEEIVTSAWTYIKQ